MCGVTEFGAKGDGIADDTAAIQAAVVACEAAGGGVVFFPAGTYRVTGEIDVHGGRSQRPTGKKGGVTLQGASMRGSKVRASGGFTLFRFSDALNNKEMMSVRDLWLDGPGKSVAGSLAILNDTGGLYDYRSVYITNFETGIHFYDTTRGLAEGLEIWYCGTGAKFGWQSDAHTWLNCGVQHSDLGLMIGHPDALHPGRRLDENGLTFIGGTTSYNVLGWRIYDYAAQGIKFIGHYSEGNVKDGEISDPATPGGVITGVSFDSCWWDSQGRSAGIAIEVFNEAQLSFENCATPPTGYATFLEVRNDVHGNRTRIWWRHNDVTGTNGTISFASRVYDPGRDTLVFGERITHVMPADLGNLPAGSPLVDIQATGAAGAVLQEWTRRSSATNAVMSRMQIRDVSAVMRLEGIAQAFIAATSVAALPPPGPEYRGCLARVDGGPGVKDAVYVCAKDAADVYEWRPLY